MTMADTTFIVVIVLFMAALAAFVAREVIQQLAIHRPKPSLTYTAWSLATMLAVAVIWRFEVLG
jgi:hypothetical protein